MSQFPSPWQEASPREGMSPWHAVYTRHQHEKVAARNLQFRGFETFLPLYSEVHHWKDRRKNLLLPIFPCYVFLRGMSGRQFDILNTPGVHSMVEIAGRAAVIPEDEMNAIRRVLESRSMMQPCPYLKSGAMVRVKSGPLQGVEGILSRRKEGGSRLILSVELLQRSVAVEVEESMVEPLDPTKTPLRENRQIVDCSFERPFATYSSDPSLSAEGVRSSTQGEL